LYSGGLPIAEALEKLRLRLLDLTARNRLLNFKHTAAKTLQFVQGQPASVYERLVESNGRVTLNAVPEPKRADWVQRLGRLARPDVRDFARQLGISTSYELAAPTGNDRESAVLQALVYPDELERHCRKLARDAKTAVEETGANMLFLLLGFLEFPEALQATKTLLAPLVPVPVTLERGDLDRSTGTYRYALAYTGEELTENLSLREKLRADFNLELPDFTEEASLESYYRAVEQAISGRPGFKLRRQATVALVSMTKMLLVRDLDPKNWPRIGPNSALTQHEIVRMVFEGRQHDGGDLGDEYDVDHHELTELPLIFDADSSQHSALIDVVQGKNLVIEGPPGTGKSQTITNLIASAMSSGKKVLFVAEKLAALQVVKSRLTQAGLADFCLELHSNKTSKKDVLESIATRAATRYSRPAQLESMMEAVKEKRRTLSTYVELINTRRGNAQGMTIHEVLWKAERYRQKTGEAWRTAQSIKVERADQLTRAEFDSLYDELCRLVQQHERIGSFSPKAPFWGFFPRSLPPAAEVEIEQEIDRTLPALEALKGCYAAAAAILNTAEFGLSKDDARTLSESLNSLAKLANEGMADELLPKLFTSSDPWGRVSEQMLQRFGDQKSKARQLREQFDDRIHPSVIVTTAVRQEGERLLSALKNLGLGEYSPEQIRVLAEKCRLQVAEGQGALEEFRELAGVIGQRFEGSDRCILLVAVPIELSVICPREHLHRRIPELAAPGTAAIIFDAQKRFATIARRHGELSQRLYLDTAVAEREVEEALLVLREGVEWWRLFQTQHRRAVAYHRRIARNKKMSRAARREELEALYGYLRETRLAKQDARYHRAMGAHWNTDATEFEPLHALASWIEKSNARLLEAQLDVATFSPAEVTASQVAALSKADERLARAKKALEACSRILVDGPLQHAEATRKAFIACKTWGDRLTLLSALSNRLAQHAQVLADWGPSSQPTERTVQALRAKDEHRQLLENIEGDIEAKGILGNRHKGIETNIQPVLQAHAYGTAVVELNLSGEVGRVLLSEAGNAVRQRLLGRLADIERAWEPVDAFCDFLASKGELQLAAWVGCEASDPLYVDRLQARMEKARSGMVGLLDWVHYVHASRFAVERGLQDFVSLLEKEKVDRAQIPAVFGYRFFGTIAEALFDEHRRLGHFSALSHEAIRNEFRKLDHDIIQLRGKDVAAIASKLAAPPAGTSGARVADKSERLLLEYLIPQTRPRMPIRQMMKAAGRAIQEYKPCFMMGPQAVAQYLEPGAVRFDIVVMDEASQLKPEEALGAIARGSQLVVVGDPKQLPPTVFFDRLGETQEDDSQAQAALLQESILDVCMGHFRPVRTLRWHYRSQHESLIAFSNSRFYRNNLIVFPSPYARSRHLGVKSRFIQGATYENQMNPMEAAAVVDAVLAHMRDRPADSLGVATLNLKQRELIEELLDKKIRDLSYAEKFCEAHEAEGMGFFVKNLENVQGDERDVIFVSTTFGPIQGTRVVYQRFGPISRHDGWRRLNVLFTRARKSLTVFTSMRPEDIADGENVPRGTRELRAYLEYLRLGTLPDTRGDGEEPGSDFEIAVMDALEKHGYKCKAQHGVAGFRIDLAVRHPLYPNAFLAAIECDGAAYHSGRSARDRDRIRQEILERLGWEGRIYRIWSTDWYRGPANEIARLTRWLGQLKDKPMDDAYLVLPEPEIVAPATTPAAVAAAIHGQAATTLESLGVTVDQDEASMEVQVGDKVTYQGVASPQETTVTIGVSTDATKGTIAHTTPLAEALLGLQQGEFAILHQQGRPPVRFRIVRINRQREI
jgi:very-short-patch-repair endonuclease